MKYPSLSVLVDGGNYLLTSTEPTVEIEWQDVMLALPRVGSRVGAISISAKSGSKTGLSHITDWAQLFDLLDNNGRVTPLGKLLVMAWQLGEDPNPYAQNPAILVIGYVLFLKDGDLLAELLPILSKLPRPFGKSMCRRAYVDALQAVCAGLENSRSASSSMSFQVFQQLRDLERAASRADTPVHEHSTAWHRAASRVESLVDIGILEKASEAETYQYSYRPTLGLERSIASLREATDLHAWVEDYLVEIVFGPSNSQAPEPEELAQDVTEIAKGLALATTLLPIDCLLLGITCRRARAGKYCSLSQLRAAIQALPTALPQMASLAQGRHGSRAEYLSWRPSRRSL
jgi:hypothetical protein